jgi:hypothetical protein
MDQDNKGTGDRKGFSTLFTRLKPKTRGTPKTQIAVPPLTEYAVQPVPTANVSAPTPAAKLDPSGDREKTEKRYCEAVELLQSSVKVPQKNWEAFEIPEFKNLADVIHPIPQLQEDIKKTLDARASSFNDPRFWSTSKRVAERIFTAITPFAINFLSVANEGSAVWSVEETVR